MRFNHLNIPNHWEHYWTRYPEGYTILEALISWVNQVDTMVDNQNNLNEKVEQFRNEIDEFVERFDDRLQDEVTQILSEWQDSGFINVVISEALQWQLDDHIESNIIQFDQTEKLLFPSGADDTDQIINALLEFDNVTLMSGVYNANIVAEVSHRTIRGRNATIKGTLEITGDNNNLLDLNIETSAGVKGLIIRGDYNTVRKGKVYGHTKYPAGTTVNYQSLLTLSGSHNTVDNVDTFNGGTGITIGGGIGNTIKHNFVHDNTIGIRNGPSAINTNILFNSIIDNDASTDSGADGILAHRNSTGTVVIGNKVVNSGEHGMYIQGDNIIVKDNEVSKSRSSGIKLGSHETDLFNAEPPYHLAQILVENNICYDNGASGIYMQTPYENITIRNNQCYNNGDTDIKTVYIASERFLANGVVVSGNQADSMWVVGNTSTSVLDNIIKRDLYMTARGTVAPDRLVSPIIRGNDCGEGMSIQRVTNATIENNNIVGSFAILEDANPVLKGNHFILSTDLNLRRMIYIENNVFEFTNGAVFTGPFQVRRFANNIVKAEVPADILLFNTDWGTGVDLIFTGNEITIGTTGKFLRLMGTAKTIVKGNIFHGGQSGPVVEFRNNSAIFTENIFTGEGTIALYDPVVGVFKNNRATVLNPASQTRLISDNF